MKEKAMMMFMVPVIKSLVTICGLDKELKEAKKEIKRLKKEVDDAIRIMGYERERYDLANRYACKLLSDNEELIKMSKALSQPPTRR